MRTKPMLRFAVATIIAVGAGGAALAQAGVTPSTPSAAERAQLLEDKQQHTAPPAGERAPKSSSTLRQDCPADMPANVTAVWRFKPANMAAVRAKADSIVLADVVSVRQDADDVLAAPGEPGGEIRTPMQIVTMKVKTAYKGPSRAGDTVTLSKLGGECYRVDEDPAYAKGETHLLMLERGARGHLQTVSPEGRYEQLADGSLEPAGHSAVAESAKGKRPDAVAR
jgi:hypothetical protein